MAGAADKKEAEITSLNRQVDWRTQQLRLMQGQRFGASSEQTLALPLYRQEQKTTRIGVPISRQTMANWIMAAQEGWFADFVQVSPSRKNRQEKVAKR